MLSSAVTGAVSVLIYEQCTPNIAGGQYYYWGAIIQVVIGVVERTVPLNAEYGAPWRGLSKYRYRVDRVGGWFRFPGNPRFQPRINDSRSSSPYTKGSLRIRALDNRPQTALKQASIDYATWSILASRTGERVRAIPTLVRSSPPCWCYSPRSLPYWYNLPHHHCRRRLRGHRCRLA